MNKYPFYKLVAFVFGFMDNLQEFRVLILVLELKYIELGLAISNSRKLIFMVIWNHSLCL